MSPNTTMALLTLTLANERIEELERIESDLRARVAELEGDLSWHKESLARHAAKLASVWQGISEAVEKATGKPCGPEPFNDLGAALAAHTGVPAAAGNALTDEQIVRMYDRVQGRWSQFNGPLNAIYAFARAIEQHLRAAPQAAQGEGLTDEQYQAILRPVLSRIGMQRYLNGDPIELDPSDYRTIINRAAHTRASDGKDSERYRWLRAHFEDVFACDDGGELVVQVKSYSPTCCERLDTAIDAAIAAKIAQGGA